MAADLDAIQARADAVAVEGYGGEWHWDGGTLVDKDHDEAVGVTRDRAAPTSVGIHIAAMDPPTVLALVAELRAAREAKKRLVKVLEYASYPDPDLESLRRIMAGWDEALDEIVRGDEG